MDRGHTLSRQELNVEQGVSVASLTSSDETELGVGRVDATEEATTKSLIFNNCMKTYIKICKEDTGTVVNYYLSEICH